MPDEDEYPKGGEAEERGLEDVVVLLAVAKLQRWVTESQPGSSKLRFYHVTPTANTIRQRTQ